MHVNRVFHEYQSRYFNYVNILSYLETHSMSNEVTLNHFQVYSNMKSHNHEAFCDKFAK